MEPMAGTDRMPKVPVFLAFAVQVSSSAPIFLLGPLAVSMRADLRLDRPALGFVASVAWLTATVASFGAGRLIAALGTRTAMVVVAVLGAAAAVGVSFAHSRSALVGGMVVDGLALALVQPATVIWLTETVPRAFQGRAVGINQASGPTAALCSGIAVPLIVQTVGWRAPFALAAAGALGVAFVVRAARFRSTMPLRPVEPSASAKMVPLRTLVAIAVAIGLAFSAAQGFLVFIVSSATDDGVPDALAALLYSVGAALSIGTRIWHGHLADRRGEGYFAAAGWLLLGGAAGMALLAVGRAALGAILMPMLFAALWGWSGTFMLGVVELGRDAPARAFGVVMTGAFAGAFTGPLLFGRLANSAFWIAWLVFAAVAGVAGVVMRSCENLPRAVATADPPLVAGRPEAAC